MSSSPQKKKDSEDPSTLPPVSGHTSSQTTQQLQEKQQSQPVCTWSAYAPQLGPSPSPFSRSSLALSTSATVAGELFLFGGYVHTPWSLSNDLYVISTRDFSTTLLKTIGDVPRPRYGHRVVLTSTTLLIWGGTRDKYAQNPCNGNRLYLLNLVSRQWTRIVVNGPRPDGRFYHTMTLVGSKLFVFGGRTGNRRFVNDIWVLDLNCLRSNPFWESYEPAPGNKKPLPRSAHVSETTGDRIIIFGGYGGTHKFNDTWSFNILTRKWTEIQCTGSIPSPRAGHAAVLIGDVMYVFGGISDDKIYLDDLTALNLSTQRWIAFQSIGPSPSGRSDHAMGCDGTRVFVLGGQLPQGIKMDEAELIHVLDTQHLVYPEPDSDAINPSEKTTQLVGKSSASPPTGGQPHQPTPSLSDSCAAHHASPFRKAAPGELDHPTSQQITHERNPNLNDLPSRPTGASDRPGRIPEEDDDSEGSTEHHAKFVAPDTPSGNEIAQLKDGRLIELEQQLLAMRAAQTERDRRIGQLTDELALKSALLAQAAEERERAGQELCKLQAKLGESLQSHDQALDQAQSALQEATLRAAEANEQSQRELAEVHAKLDARESELAAVHLRLIDAEDSCAKNKAEAEALRAGTRAAAGLVSMDVDRVMRRLVEHVRVVEAEMASLRGNEKSIEEMECRNEE